MIARQAGPRSRVSAVKDEAQSRGAIRFRFSPLMNHFSFSQVIGDLWIEKVTEAERSPNHLNKVHLNPCSTQYESLLIRAHQSSRENPPISADIKCHAAKKKYVWGGTKETTTQQNTRHPKWQLCKRPCRQFLLSS